MLNTNPASTANTSIVVTISRLCHSAARCFARHIRVCGQGVAHGLTLRADGVAEQRRPFGRHDLARVAIQHATRPRARTTTRSEAAGPASRGSCPPRSPRRQPDRPCMAAIRPTPAASRAVSGSSSSSSRGRCSTARARATRCCNPRDSVRTGSSARALGFHPDEQFVQPRRRIAQAIEPLHSTSGSPARSGRRRARCDARHTRSAAAEPHRRVAGPSPADAPRRPSGAPAWASSRSRVVLPAPLGPTTATRWPAARRGVERHRGPGGGHTPRHALQLDSVHVAVSRWDSRRTPTTRR